MIFIRYYKYSFVVSQTQDNLPWYLAKITFFCEEYNKYFSGSLAQTCRHVARMGGTSDRRPSATTPKITSLLCLTVAGACHRGLSGC